MLRKWFSAREAVDAGIALADKFPRPSTPASAVRGKAEQRPRAHGAALGDYLRRAAHEVGTLRLNFYKRAWFANSFKWRLLENGVDAETANEWTQTLVLEASSKKIRFAPSDEASVAQTNRPGSKKARSLSRLADDSYARGAYAEAVTHLEDLVVLRPRDAAVLNRLGAALSKVGRYPEAEDYFFARRSADSRIFPRRTAILGLCTWRGVGSLKPRTRSGVPSCQIRPTWFTAAISV